MKHGLCTLTSGGATKEVKGEGEEKLSEETVEEGGKAEEDKPPEDTNPKPAGCVLVYRDYF